MKNKLRYSGPIIISMLFFISFIGECVVVDPVDSGMDDSGDGSINPSPTLDDHLVDDSYQEPETESTDSAYDSIYDPASDDSTNTVEPVVEDTSTVVDTATDSIDSNLDAPLNDIDSSVDTQVNNNDSTNSDGSKFYQMRNQVEISYDNLEYWLDVFELTGLDEELKARFLELAKKEYFIYEVKLKISELLNDISLSEDEFRIRLLIFIKTASSNERDVSTEEIALQVEGEVSSVSIGTVTQFITTEFEDDIGVEKVQLVTNRDLSEVKVSIIQLKQKPDDVPLTLRKNQSVYQYLDIKLTENDNYVSDEDINSLNFTFKVAASWIEENNIDKNTVVLIRYHDGEWLNLSTKLLSENDTYFVFVAETEGCSTFAVVGSSLVEISEPYVTETPDIPWTFIVGITSATTFLLGFILFKARYIYFGEDENKKTIKKR